MWIAVVMNVEQVGSHTLNPKNLVQPKVFHLKVLKAWEA